MPFLRPAELATDTARSVDAVLHAIRWLEDHERETFEYLVLLEPTAPLREASDIEAALALLEARPEAESVVAVAQVEARHPAFVCELEAGFLKPYGQARFTPMRRQELPECYFFTGTVYVSRVAALKAGKGFYHDKTLPLCVPKEKSFEVDDSTDWGIVEHLLKRRLAPPGE